MNRVGLVKFRKKSKKTKSLATPARIGLVKFKKMSKKTK